MLKRIISGLLAGSIIIVTILLLPKITTFAPFFAKPIAVALPIPLAAPVIKAVLPSKFLIISKTPFGC